VPNAQFYDCNMADRSSNAMYRAPTSAGVFSIIVTGKK